MNKINVLTDACVHRFYNKIHCFARGLFHKAERWTFFLLYSAFILLYFIYPAKGNSLFSTHP